MRAHHGLGLFKRKGLGCPVDHQAALAHFNVAADANVHEAKVYVGDAHRLGQGTSKNLDKAIEFYEAALKKLNRRLPEYEHAQFMLAQCMESSNPQKAQELYQKYSKGGNSKASFRLYQMYVKDPKQAEAAKSVLATAAQQGHPQAQQQVEVDIRKADAAILDEF